MTITIALPTVCTSIAALSISGVSVRNTNNIPQSADFLGPFLAPQAVNFITNLTPARMSFGSNGVAAMDLSYDLNYVFVYAPQGGGLSEYDGYTALITAFLAVLTVIFNNDKITGLVDLTINTPPQIGTVEDPAGNQYWGALFTLHVLEQIQ
jgi:hypothetical protein